MWRQITCRCPVLALLGEKDLQVDAKQNREALEKHLTHKNYTVITFPKANHLFQEALTGAVVEYPSLSKEFVASFRPAISRLIHSGYSSLPPS
jgi:dienelactone hydrolase